MTLIIHFKIFGQKGVTILEKSHDDHDLRKPMFVKGFDDCLQDMTESVASGFTKNPKKLFNYLVKKN